MLRFLKMVILPLPATHILSFLLENAKSLWYNLDKVSKFIRLS
jgi:hypothetical protein